MNHGIHAMLPAGRRVTLESFWLMDIQSLCHIPNKPDNKYFPCEVGVLRYSLNQGVQSKFHRFIVPGQYITTSGSHTCKPSILWLVCFIICNVPVGPIPIGYRYEAQSTSESTNQIPVEGTPDAIGDYRKLLGELEHYLTCDGTTADIPPVFTKVSCKSQDAGVSSFSWVYLSTEFVCLSS